MDQSKQTAMKALWDYIDANCHEENFTQQNEFIPYEQALELKELGYDIDSVSGYSYPDSDKLLTQAILYQQAFRWFRERGYYTDLFVDDNKTFGFCITYFRPLERVDSPIQRGFNTYEEAELACLRKLIEIVKNK